MKLYYSPGACSLAPHIVLCELGLTHALEIVNLKTSTYSGGEFKKVNPKGHVPTLELATGEILTEAATILQYLGEQKPEGGLLPRAGSMERWRCLEWTTFISTELHKGGFGPLWNDATPEEYKNMTTETLFQRFDFVDRGLRDRDYLLGKQFTIADAYLFTVMGWARFLKIDISRFKALVGYVGRVAARPGVQAALRAEGLLK